jgi:hypothetical protein
MARVPKRSAVKQAVGLPSKEQIMTAPQNTDTIPAVIHGQNGAPQQPAALTEGEFVFSLPAIIALGEGNYDEGLAILTQMHDQLKEEGKAFLAEQNNQGLATVGN